MRSKLFVPCARPDLFTKAVASEADAISFDLEDSVPPDGKADARGRLVAFLKSDAVRATNKTLIVRINALGTPFGHDDLAALPQCTKILVNVPKAENSDDVRAVAALTSASLLVNVETPRGLRRAAEIAAAHPKVIGLQAGLNDLFAPLGIVRGDQRPVFEALWQIRLAAGEAGCFAYDGAWPDITDEVGFRAEAVLARDMGFLGKSCIHPRQVSIINNVFDRTGAIEDARRLLEAAESAAKRGHGAFAFEGKIVDRPQIEQARSTLSAAGEHDL
ncbi:MAG: CoA ester lyase [Alphaproteobacteria bacterium HGW-Alphaproteobacteria-7]|jgi:citrate lyase subunit beta/citryl-CoA lyase|nr:MAG: CoA ester lyase [Alphaproteobacteria bacterium HGW-Alphaproteobacteria-7]